MGDTTSIDDLPTDPSSGNMNNNVVLQKMELSSGAGGGMQGQPQSQGQIYNPNIPGLSAGPGQSQGQVHGQGLGVGSAPHPQQQQQMLQMPPPPNIMNEMISGLQRASASGMTSLPSRDIPMNTTNMMNDTQIKPNFIPNPQDQQMNQYGPRPESSNNYIEEHEQDMTSEEKYRKSQIINSTSENIYKLIQIPVIVGILYFAFQLPVTRKYILKFIPSVFNSDGNYNISGLVFMSALFASSFFGLSKVLEMSETW
jgi:hypothetical protein